MWTCRETSSCGRYRVPIEPLSSMWLMDEVNPARLLLEFPPLNPYLSSRDFIVLDEVIMAHDLRFRQ